MNIVRCLILVANFLLFIWSTECASILGLFVWPARSHFIIGNRLMKELAHRGHEVTMVTAYSENTTMENYRTIVLEDLNKISGKLLSTERLLNLGRRRPIYQLQSLAQAGETTVKETLKQPAFQKLVNSNETFDLVVLDIVGTEALIGLGHRFNCPVLGIDGNGMPHYTNHLVGYPAAFAYMPQFYSTFGPEMNLFQRISNTLSGIMCEGFKSYVHMPNQDALLKQYLKDGPNLEEVILNHLSVILLNNHPSISGAIENVPAIVNVGGFHMQKPKALPKEIQTFLDEAKNGAILFSLGSLLTSAEFPIDKRNIILKSIAKFSMKVLWKYENAAMLDTPENVKTVQWLPQNDVLAHPNIKGFITHGGLLSITESIYNGVPIIGMSGFADQHMNTEIAVQKGYGLKVEMADLTEETLTNALDKIINDPRYLECARKHSRIVHDQAMKPMDKAVFWIEYVIRHGGAKHLRSPSMNLHWTQIYLLDVISVLIFLCAALFVSIRTVVKRLVTKFKTNVKTKTE